MPYYEYKHDEENLHCESVIEVVQKMSDDKLTKCPKCGNACHRIISRTHGKMEKEKNFVWEDDNGKLHNTKLSSNKKEAEEQVKEHYRQRGENPDNYEVIVP